MLFNSFNFLFIFFPIVLFCYYQINHFKNKNYKIIFLIISSLVFYAYWNFIYIFLLILSIVANFILAKIIVNLNYKKLNLYKKMTFVLAIILNVILLCYFKYYNFFIENINTVFSLTFNFKNVILPLAISFFTIQQINFIVEIYYGKNHDFDFLKYILFVSFFPQLIAGPIVTYSHFISQFYNDKKDNFYKNFTIGLIFLSLGLFKKIYIADSFGLFSNILYDQSLITDSLNAIDILIGTFCFTFQIYFDFSAYSDMAIGIAYFFGIKLPDNFNSPFKAENMINFWSKWHITLTQFLNRNIFMFLSFYLQKKFTPHNSYTNQNIILTVFLPIMITFFISGLWHGASWTFVFWAMLHALYLIFNYFIIYLLKKYKINFQLNIWLRRAIVLFMINLAFIYFRAENLQQANFMFVNLFNFKSNLIFDNYLIPILLLIIGLAICWLMPNTKDYALYYSNKNLENNKNKILNFANNIFYFSLIIFTLLVFSLAKISKPLEFIYFQF